MDEIIQLPAELNYTNDDGADEVWDPLRELGIAHPLELERMLDPRNKHLQSTPKSKLANNDPQCSTEDYMPGYSTFAINTRNDYSSSDEIAQFARSGSPKTQNQNSAEGSHAEFYSVRTSEKQIDTSNAEVDSTPYKEDPIPADEVKICSSADKSQTHPRKLQNLDERILQRGSIGPIKPRMVYRKRVSYP